MHLKSRPGLALLLAACLACLAFVGVAGAAYPAMPAARASQAALITDPLHHISGVVAVPPRSLKSKVQSPKSSGPEFGLRSLDSGLGGGVVFGPNVDATLNNPSAQN